MFTRLYTHISTATHDNLINEFYTVDNFAKKFNFQQAHVYITHYIQRLNYLLDLSNFVKKTVT